MGVITNIGFRPFLRGDRRGRGVKINSLTGKMTQKTGRLAGKTHFWENYFCVQVFGPSCPNGISAFFFRVLEAVLGSFFHLELLPTVGRNFLKFVI
jgi:hypothetical protein